MFGGVKGEERMVIGGRKVQIWRQNDLWRKRYSAISTESR